MNEQFAAAGFTPEETAEFCRAYRNNEKAILHWAYALEWDKNKMMRRVRHATHVTRCEPATGHLGAVYTGD